LLFMSFFPKLIEGPITRYNEFRGILKWEDINSRNLATGYQRILWGLFKKLVIADQIAPAVNALYEWEYMDGWVALCAAAFFTIQEYMDFSGAIDIAVGSARIFNLKLSDSFVSKGKGLGRTYNGVFPAYRIDYVFYKKEGFKIKEYSSPALDFSDHYPVLVRFSLK
ncbi:MAG: hypothetical protein IJ748_01275, partial [Bacteroidales bacterium]|nr:hypothetical protein [Bacteroidales bacterium]